MTSNSAIKQANLAFYGAFEALDFDAMSRVWAQRTEDVCIHPGWEVLTEWKNIKESWRAIFANTAFVRIEVSEVNIEVLGEVARVTCIESLFSVIEGQTIHSQVACTNLFVQTPEGWRLTLHHGSTIASQPISVPELDLH